VSAKICGLLDLIMQTRMLGWDLDEIMNHDRVTCDSAELNSMKRCGTEFTHSKCHYYFLFTEYQMLRLVVAVDLDHQCVSSVPMLFCSR